MLVRDIVTGLRMGLEKHMKMVYTFKKLNNVIFRSVYSTSFVSLFYGELESNGNLLYVNAGHPSPLLFTENGITELESTGLIFGAIPQIELHRSHVFVKPGDILLLYTDGIYERNNPGGEEFGIDRLKEIVTNNKDKTASEILELIFDTTDKFGDRVPWEDDATVIVIKKTGKKN